MNPYIKTQGWEGVSLQKGRGVYQQCYIGKELLQLNPENGMVFMQQDGMG